MLYFISFFFFNQFKAPDWTEQAEGGPGLTMSYLLVLAPLHAVLVVAVLGSGEAGGQRGRAGSVQDGGPGELVPLPAALPLRLSRVHALLQGVWHTSDRESCQVSCRKAGLENDPL